MIEITSIRLYKGGFAPDGTPLKHFGGSWKSDRLQEMGFFSLVDCPPFRGWLYDGAALITLRNPGGMDGEFTTSGRITKLRA